MVRYEIIMYYPDGKLEYKCSNIPTLLERVAWFLGTTAIKLEITKYKIEGDDR